MHITHCTLFIGSLVGHIKADIACTDEGKVSGCLRCETLVCDRRGKSREYVLPQICISLNIPSTVVVSVRLESLLCQLPNLTLAHLQFIPLTKTYSI